MTFFTKGIHFISEYEEAYQMDTSKNLLKLQYNAIKYNTVIITSYLISDGNYVQHDHTRCSLPDLIHITKYLSSRNINVIYSPVLTYKNFNITDITVWINSYFGCLFDTKQLLNEYYVTNLFVGVGVDLSNINTHTNLWVDNLIKIKKFYNYKITLSVSDIISLDPILYTINNNILQYIDYIGFAIDNSVICDKKYDECLNYYMTCHNIANIIHNSNNKKLILHNFKLYNDNDQVNFLNAWYSISHKSNIYSGFSVNTLSTNYQKILINNDAINTLQKIFNLL